MARKQTQDKPRRLATKVLCVCVCVCVCVCLPDEKSDTVMGYGALQ